MPFVRGGINPTVRTAETRERFLQLLAEEASVSKVCRVLGVKRSSMYDWRRDDLDFREAWDQAADLGTDALEDEAVIPT